MVVVATQGHGDEEVLEQAVAAYPAFVGLVGSRKRGEAVLGYLADRGVPQNLLDRVKVPVGVDLGHTSHREIAVAILAELVQVRAAGGLVLEMTGSSAPATATTVIDPVCGMTVEPGPSTPSATPRRRDVLLLLRGLQDELRTRPARLPQGGRSC